MRYVNSIFAVSAFSLIFSSQVSAQGTTAQSAPLSPVFAIGAVSAGYAKDKRNGYLGETRWNEERVSAETQIGSFSFGLSGGINSSRKVLQQHILESGVNAGATVFGGTATTNNAFVAGNVGYHIDSWHFNTFVENGAGTSKDFRQGGGVTATWDRKSHSLVWGGSVAREFRLGDGWYVTPAGRYVWAKNMSTETRDSLGNTVVAEQDLSVRGLVGGEFGYKDLLGDLVATAGVRSYYVHDFHLARNFADRSAYDLSAFLTLAGEQTISGVELSTTVGRKETDSMSGRLFVGFRF